MKNKKFATILTIALVTISGYGYGIEKYIPEENLKPIIASSVTVYSFRGEENILDSSIVTLPEEGKKLLLDAINAAQTSIDITAYKLTDPDIIDGLSYAHNRGVKVRILAEPNIFTHAHAVNQEGTPINELREKGFSVFTLKIPMQMHYKMLVIDNKQGMVLTGNFAFNTFNSTKRSRNFAVITSNQEVIEEMSSVFEGDINGKMVMPASSQLIWGPWNQRERFVELLNGAKKSILFYQQALNDEGMIGLLLNALERGVIVKGLMSPYPFNLDDDGNIRSKAVLEKAGGIIKLIDHQEKSGFSIHAKVLLIDTDVPNESIAYIGSCNLSKSTLDQNRELGILLKDSQSIQTVLRKFGEDFSR